MKKTNKFKGLTLVELCISIATMSLVMILAVHLLGLSLKGFVGINEKITTEHEEATFAAMVNDKIRESTVLHTIPEKSFIDSKLTSTWEYVGVMDDVVIPAECSKTGERIPSAKALVYIEYLGKAKPTKYPDDERLIFNSGEGYFFRNIIGYNFTDSNGLIHDYSLKFNKVADDEDEAEAGTEKISNKLTFEFVSEIKDKNGNHVGDGDDVDIATMLSSINSAHIVYNGFEDNPAVAIAFQPHFLPIYGAAAKEDHPTVNIALVVDMSSGLLHLHPQPDGTVLRKIDAIKPILEDFVNDFAKNPNINIIFVPYSYWGGYQGVYGPENQEYIDNDEQEKHGLGSDYRKKTHTKYIYNVQNERDELLRVIDEMEPDGGSNCGDGLRIAYNQFSKLQDLGIDDEGNNFVIVVTGGCMNYYSIKDDDYGFKFTHGFRAPEWRDAYLENSSPIPPGVWDASTSGENDSGRYYMQHWKTLLDDDCHIDRSYFVGVFDQEIWNENSTALRKDIEVIEDTFGEYYKETIDFSEIKEIFKFIGEDILELIASVNGPHL